MLISRHRGRSHSGIYPMGLSGVQVSVESVIPPPPRLGAFPPYHLCCNRSFPPPLLLSCSRFESLFHQSRNSDLVTPLALSFFIARSSIVHNHEMKRTPKISKGLCPSPTLLSLSHQQSEPMKVTVTSLARSHLVLVGGPRRDNSSGWIPDITVYKLQNISSSGTHDSVSIE